jgi:membrane protease YdiL (CAAX protease family)
MSDPEAQTEIKPPPAPEFAAASQPSYARTLFLGPDGLRAGWGFVFYVAMFVPLRDVGVNLVASSHLAVLWTMLLEELAVLAAAVIPALVLMRVERRPWSVYGLPVQRAFGKAFWAGTVWGFAGVSVLVVAMYELRGFSFGHIVLRTERMVKFGLFWAFMFLIVGLAEEFAFRGYTVFTLTRGIQFWPAAFAMSILFGLVHLQNEGEQWTGALAAAAIGLFFCLTLRRTGTLWFAVGFHAAWDWGESFFYSVPDSGMRSPGHLLSSSMHGPAWLTGGSVGPEGSLLCFGVIAVTWAAFSWRYPKAVYSAAETAALPATTDSSSLRSSE